ncbi:MAG: YraN family protein [Hydrogenophaga sp.]|jgi:putative endonuclease|nr:YraN family protein [Hydrogenophaga sp.]
MWFSRKQGVSPAGGAAPSTKRMGDAAEDRALAHLQAQGLGLVQRNFRTPGRGGGELDLIMRERDGTLVFVEVRHRTSARQGGAAASITVQKQRRIVFAARHFLLRLGSEPPCRFDVVLIQGDTRAQASTAQAVSVEWIRAAFDASAHG